MKQLYALLACWLLATPLLAQGNYVANVANSTTPGQYNTLIGPNAGTNSIGSQNVFIGVGGLQVKRCF